ncbi:DUF262 domain-containing protein [Prosthecobacter sp. SYSU 5D2]|uniref:DUF262 domain-containing protein n=1 Tax=Prosthecobacter sp. SYSU 5D2 TaxID=3134134 RepID=UPI0031FEA8B6
MTPNLAAVESPGTVQTSEFESLSIYEVIGRLNSSQQRPLYLPAIQRRFVWGMAQICELFDSMMRGYPIGTFLFWEVADELRNDYAFYEFIRDYNEHADHRANRTAPRTLPPGLTGVLDGQQRLNSMYVALQGSYSAFIGGQGNFRARLDSFPRREFHLNVFFAPAEDDKQHYQFRFLTEWESSPVRFDAKHYWFPVSAIYHSTCQQEVERQWMHYVTKTGTRDKLTENQSEKAISTLELLRRRIRDEKLITYFPIRQRDLTEALQIFIRANNGGTTVTDAQMIFSTIIAHWQEGRARIEALRDSINDLGNGFQFEITHIMLACLALSGCPIRLRIESFKPAHVDTIRECWPAICETLQAAANMAVRWGLSGNHGIRQHSIIALAILLRAGVKTPASDDHLRLFVLRSLVCELYRRPERTLALVQEYADDHLALGSVFVLDHFESVFELPSGQGLGITPEDLEKLLTIHIGDSRTYVLLTLLHHHHAVHQHAFQKDHIHPSSRFADLKEFKLGSEGEALWHQWKDQLPNIQLLQEGENNYKRAKAFKDWLPIYLPNSEAQKAYLAQNDIPADVSLDFVDFESFFNRRKERLRQRLKNLLGVSAVNES